MKSMYQCERCGRIFEDYSECEKCESRHWIFQNNWTSDGLSEKLDSMIEYKEGQEEPNIIHVWMQRWEYDDETGKGEYKKRCGKYKLVSSYDAPMVIENE